MGIENLMLKNLLKGMKDIKKGQRFLREGNNLEVKQSKFNLSESLKLKFYL